MLKGASRYKKIAVVGAFNMVYGSESVSQVYKDVTIKSYFTEKEIYLKEIVKQAIEDGAQICGRMLNGYHRAGAQDPLSAD